MCQQPTTARDAAKSASPKKKQQRTAHKVENAQLVMAKELSSVFWDQIKHVQPAKVAESYDEMILKIVTRQRPKLALYE